MLFFPLLASAFLYFYYRATGVWVSAAPLLSSFQGNVVDRPFAWGAFCSLWFSLLASVFIWSAWMAVAWALGRLLARLCRWEQEDAMENHLIALALGLGALSMACYGLCALHLLSRPWVLSLLSIGGLLAAVLGKQLAPRPASFVTTSPGSFMDGPLWAVAAIAGAALFFHLMGALLPPVAFDEMNYQLALPKLYVLNKGFVPLMHNHLSFLPKNMNMLFSLGLLSGGPVVAKLFSFGAGLLAALALYVFSRHWLGKQGALVAAALFILTPVIGNQYRLATSDLGTGFYEILGLFLTLRWRPEMGRRPLLLAAVLWGLALGCKYTSIPGFSIALALLAWRLWSQKTERKAWTSWLLFIGAALLVWSPWLILNLVQSGNPFTPLLSRWIHSRNFDFAGTYMPLVDYSRGLGIANYFPFQSWKDVFLFPWHLLTRHNDFNHYVGPALVLASAGALWRARPLWLAAGAAALFLWPLTLPAGAVYMLWKSRKSNSPLWLIGTAVLLYWLAWILTGVRMTRYFTVGLGLTCLLAGAAWNLSINRIKNNLKYIVIIPFLISILQQTLSAVFIQNTYKMPWGYMAGRCSLSRYLRATLSPHSPVSGIEFINGRLPPDAKILVVNEFRTFYLDRDFRAGTPWDFDDWQELLRLSDSPQDLHMRLRARGFTHIFINEQYVLQKTGRSTVRNWTDEDKRKHAAFLPMVSSPLYAQDNLWVGEILPIAPR